MDSVKEHLGNCTKLDSWILQLQYHNGAKS